jgi:hypothetical protein
LAVHANGEPLVEGIEIPDISTHGKVFEAEPELRGAKEPGKILDVVGLLHGKLARLPTLSGDRLFARRLEVVKLAAKPMPDLPVETRHCKRPLLRRV